MSDTVAQTTNKQEPHSTQHGEMAGAVHSDAGLVIDDEMVEGEYSAQRLNASSRQEQEPGIREDDAQEDRLIYSDSGIVLELGDEFKPELEHVDIGDLSEDDDDEDDDELAGIDRGTVTQSDIVVLTKSPQSFQLRIIQDVIF